jgi:hypothetical protein
MEHATGCHVPSAVPETDPFIKPGCRRVTASSPAAAKTCFTDFRADTCVAGTPDLPLARRPDVTPKSSRAREWLCEQEYLLSEMERLEGRGEHETMLSILHDPIAAVVLYDLRRRNGDRLSALQRNRAAMAPATSTILNGELLASLAACTGGTNQHFIDRLMARQQALGASLTRKAARIARLQQRLLDNVARRHR